MKQLIFLELLKKLKSKSGLAREVKIFSTVGVVGLLMTSALLVWTGLLALSYVAKKSNEVVQSSQTSAYVESLKTEFKGLPRLQPLSCWGKTQSLMAIEPWLARPALDNLKNLRVACLEEKAAVCIGHECSQMKEHMNTAEGKTT